MDIGEPAERAAERKEQIVEALSFWFSHNALSMAEYERLLDYINKAESERELRFIEKIVEEGGRYAGKDQDGDDQEPHRETAPVPGEGGWTNFSFALLSSREISGETLRSRPCSLVSLLGSHAVDIREGDLPPGRTKVDMVSILGETKITVPPGVAVTMRAFPLAGEAKVCRGVETQRSPGKPELVITGIALLGNITVKLRKEKRRFFKSP
jgi:hypothetical protein